MMTTYGIVAIVREQPPRAKEGEERGGGGGSSGKNGSTSSSKSKSCERVAVKRMNIKPGSCSTSYITIQSFARSLPLLPSMGTHALEAYTPPEA